jgi:DNA-binding NarL/FixJ family response regulator
MRTGLILSDDLIFTSRVTGTGRDLDFAICFAKTPEALLNLARGNSPACVIVDLSNPGLNIGEFVAALKQLSPAPTVVAYGSHVDVATLKAARAAGCDFVMPRSQFVEALPRDLAAWMTPAAG